MGQVPVGKSCHKHSLIPAAVLAVCLVLCLFGGIANTAMTGEADVFEKAYSLYQARQYDKAFDLFGKFLKEYPDSSARDSVMYWQAKALIHLHRREEAEKLLKTLIEQFPESTFISFAQQEIEVMKQVAPNEAGKIAAASQEPAPAQVQHDTDVCADYLKKADDKVRNLKSRLADSYTRTQFLETELNTSINDRQYLKGLLDELRQGQEGLPKSVTDVSVLKAENERLQQEIRSLSTRPAAVSGSAAGNRDAEKQELEEYRRRSKVLEEKNRDILQKALAYIRQTDERIGKLESERDQMREKLRQAGLRQEELEKQHAELDRGRSQAGVEVKKLSDEKKSLENKIHEQELALGGMSALKKENERLRAETGKEQAVFGEKDNELRRLKSEREDLAKKLKDAEAKESELKVISSRLSTAEKNLAEAQQARADSARNMDAYARLKEESSQLGPAVKKAEEQLRVLVTEKADLQGKLQESEKRQGQLEREKAEIEVQARKAMADRGDLEAKLKEKEGLAALLEKVRAEKEGLQAEQAKILAQAKQEDEDLRRLRAEKETFERRQAEAEKGRTEGEKKAGELQAQIKKLTEEKAGYEKRVGEYEAAIQGLTKAKEGYEGLKAENGKLAAAIKANEEQTQRLQRDRDDLQKQVKATSDDKARAEALLKERDNLVSVIGRLREETDTLRNESLARASAAEQASVALQKLRAERESLLGQLREKENRDQEIGGLQARLKDAERLRAETETQARKAIADRADLEKQLQEKDAALASLETLRRKLAEAEARAREADALRAKLQENERQKTDMENRTRKALDEQAVLEGTLREKESVISALEAKKAEFEKQRDGSRDAAEAYRKLDESNRLMAVLNDDYRTLMQKYEALSRERDLARRRQEEVAGRMGSYDFPVLRIGDRKYTMSEVIAESIISARVLSKMKVVSVPWRRNNPYDDFAVEQILYARAGDAVKKARRAEIERLSATYRFDSREEEYLIKYLSIDDFVKRQIDGYAVDEARIRKYYEENRNLYATGKAEKTVAMLVLPYTADTKLEEAIRMTEIESEVSGGMPFAEVLKTRHGLTVKQMPYGDLPSWIREKIRDLKPGDTGTVISTDDQYMICRIGKPEPVYRRYEDVRDSIRKALASSDILGPWLDSVRKEAEVIQ